MPTPTPPGSVQVAPGTATRPTPDFTITSAAQFTNANVNNTAYRVIAVAPGVVCPTSITLSASGTTSAPRWLMLNRPADNAHPVSLASNQQASVAGLSINGSNWIVDRMTVRNAAAAAFWSGSNNTFQFGLFDTRLGTGNGLWVSIGGTNQAILNTVFKNPLRTPGVDTYAIYLNGGSNHKVIGNEFIGIPACVQVAPGTGGGHVVSSNEMYQDSTSFTDCNGNLSSTGPCFCGEGFPFVAKGTGTAQTYVDNNFIWNYSVADEQCSGGGSGGSTGLSLGSGGQQTNNYTLRGNTLIGRITTPSPPGGRMTYGIYLGALGVNNTVSENFIANINHPFDALYNDNSTYAHNVYYNNLTGFNTSAMATGNTITPAGAGHTAVAGERSVVKYHITNPTPVSYP